MRTNLAVRNFFDTSLEKSLAGFLGDSFFSEPRGLFGYPAEYQGILNGRCDFEETDEAYTIELEVPGVKKDEIKIDLKENFLTISWSRKRESEKSQKGRYERSEGSFTRKFNVKGADQKQVKADLKDGILKIELKKQEEAQVKSISIN